MTLTFSLSNSYLSETCFRLIFRLEKSVPQHAAQLLLGLTKNPLIILLIISIFLLIVGLFMDPTPAILILTPILLPIILKIGIEPVHFGIVMILNLMIGLNTPPVGMCLYTAAHVSKTSVENVIKESLPFFIPILLVLLLIILFPNIVLFLPDIIMGN